MTHFSGHFEYFQHIYNTIGLSYTCLNKLFQVSSEHAAGLWLNKVLDSFEI